MVLSVILILVASVPLILIPVYPIPFPASEEDTTDGSSCSSMGMSCPLFLFRISEMFHSDLAKGMFSPALTEITSTGFSSRLSWIVWPELKRQSEIPIDAKKLFIDLVFSAVPVWSRFLFSLRRHYPEQVDRVCSQPPNIRKHPGKAVVNKLSRN